MLRNKKITKGLSLLITMVMVLGYMTSFVYAEDNQLSSARVDLIQEASEKIELDLKKDLEKEDLVEIMVYMADRVDTGMVAQATRKATSYQTPYNTKIQVRNAVLDSLQDKAEMTQANLLKYLEQEMERGNVEEYTSYHLVNMVYVKATKEVVDNISYMREVEKIYKNKVHMMETPIIAEDVEPAAEGVEWNITRIGADQAWDLGYDGTGAVVGSLDSGVDWTHPALKNHWRGYDPNTGATDPSKSWFDPVYSAQLPADSDSHGTHVMGTMIGQEPDGSNPVGVAPGAKWITARVFNTAGSTTDAILLSAAQWMTAPGGDRDAAPDVVNNSWGGGAGIDSWYMDAVDGWINAGIFPVFSAGNQRTGEPAPWPGSISVPANYPQSFAVAAVDRYDAIASFSKLGPSPYDESLIKPEISGPGVSIKSSIPGGYTSGYSGTSMSAPHISGTVALLKSANSSLTVDEIGEILKDTADPLTNSTYPSSPNMGFGYGMVNAFEAVSQVAAGTGYVAGRVLQEGEDLEDLVIRHDQEIFETYTGSDIEITAEITDDIAVLEAELLVKQEGKSYWMLVPMNKVSGDHKDGIYKGTITYDMLLGDSLVYKIRARDYAGEVVISQDYRVDISFGVKVDEYSQGFENNINGWIMDGVWEWGLPSGTSPAPYEGEQVAGTILNGSYTASADSWMITPPIDLRDGSIESATLRFNHWYLTQATYDYGTVLLTNDYGNTWIEAGPQYSGASADWKEVVVNLGEYIGSNTPVFAAFRFVSNTYTQDLGWYVDNVRLVGVDTEAPAVPTDLAAIPNIRGIKLAWLPVMDGDLDHYNIYRSDMAGGEYVKVSETLNNTFVDDTVEANSEYYYVVDSEDFSGNLSEYSNEANAIALGYTALFGTDFENDNGGFTLGLTAGTANDWEWGTPTSGPNAANSGVNLWATNLAGNYTRSNDAYIESPAIIIPENSGAVLTFTHWYDLEGTSTLWDYGQVQVSNDDGATWTNITPGTGGKYGTRLQQWLTEEIDLSDFDGETIKIRFFFHSDSSVFYSGWYVDDVYIMGASAEGEEPIPVDKTELWNVYWEYAIFIAQHAAEYTPESVAALGEAGQFAADVYHNEEATQEEVDEAIQVMHDAFEGLVPINPEPETKGEEFIASEPNFRINRNLVSRNKYETVSDMEVANTPMARGGGIPLANAVVTVLETGRSVKNDPVNGSYSMRMPMGTYTLRAEAYGFYSEDIVIDVEEDLTTNATFILEPKPHGTIIGRIVDRYYGDPASNATIRIVEDSKVLPVVADEDGYFTIPNVLVGTYTLKVVAEGFDPGEFRVTVNPEETTEVLLELKRFVGFEDEIIYDDGVGENALVLNSANYGLAVRFTPEQFGKVTGANVYFWDTSWPAPGGDRIGFAIYSTDENGVASKVGEPIFQDIVRGAWNRIDLSSFGFSTDRDFYISTIQDAAGTSCPGTGIDEHSPYADRSYLNLDGTFELLSSEDIVGGLMIRALVENSVSTPEITNLQKTSYTNQDAISVEGIVGADCIVNVYVNGAIAATVNSEELRFTAEVELPLDTNKIMVTSELDGRQTEPSPVVTVIKDKAAPILVVDQPLDNAKVNVEVVHVIGNVVDDIELAKLEINEVEIVLDEEGNFHERLMLNPGENIITVKATDGAGNVTIVERTVLVELEAPDITNIEPSGNVELREGDILTVSFNAPTGGNGYFRILMPFGLQNDELGIPMTEVDGLYSGTWTVPANLVATGLKVQVVYVNEYGFKITKLAEGSVTVIGNLVDLVVNSMIIGNEAFDMDYLNTNAYAQSRLMEAYNSGEEVYIKLNENTIVNGEGEMITINELPEEVRYFDINGDILYFAK